MPVLSPLALLGLALFGGGSSEPLASTLPQEGAAAPSNQLSIYLGQRALDEDDYEPVEDQAMFALEFAHEPEGSTLGWELGLAGSADESEILGTDVEGATGELYGGVRKTFGSGAIRPVLGGGLSFIRSAVEVSGVGDDDDASLAGYVHGGVQFQLSTTFSLGLDARVLFGSDLEIAGVETDADYGQLALVLGFRF